MVSGQYNDEQQRKSSEVALRATLKKAYNWTKDNYVPYLGPIRKVDTVPEEGECFSILLQNVLTQ